MQDLMKKILIIDDDRDVLKVLQMALDQFDYKAFIAGGTGEAQEMLRLFSFDLIICDMNIPNESGIEFRKRMAKADPVLPPFIFCSGMVHQFPINPLPEGVAGFLSKPFPLRTLLDTVENALKITSRAEVSAPIL